MKPLLAAFVLCLLAPTRGLAFELHEVPYDKPFRSPDGRFTAVLSATGPDQTDEIIITDASTKQRAEVGVLPPLLSLRWSADSRTIVTIEHLALCTHTAVLHYQDGHWQRHEVDPLTDHVRSYFVLRQHIYPHSVDVTYKVMEEYWKADQRKPHYFVCTLRVACTTGAIRVIAKRTISGYAFGALPAHP